MNLETKKNIKGTLTNMFVSLYQITVNMYVTI
jgi:hypothetical protein